MGLEPTHLTAYAPQTYVSTIPPPGQILVYSILSEVDMIDDTNGK